TSSAGELAKELKSTSGSPISAAQLRRASELITPAQRAVEETVHQVVRLEVELQQSVFDAYGLEPNEINLVLESLPPRDPLAVARSTFSLPASHEPAAPRASEG